MDSSEFGSNRSSAVARGAAAQLAAQLRTAAFEAWASQRDTRKGSSISLFDRVYLGHYSHVDHYIETLVDRYGLDDKLDAAIVQPFRDFVDIDISALARSLVRRQSIYCLTAIPVGVWVFNGDVE